MSFLPFRYDRIEYGDTAFIYLNPKAIHAVPIEKGKVFQSVFGALKHDFLVGQPYGVKIQCPKGYVYILKATPELWTTCLPHRTQILYFADISFIVSNLDVKPGSLVGEAGTGSGSMTHSLIRTIAPSGKVFTFDFHEKRVEDARQEFKTHGCEDLVIIQHRDVCQNGFPDDLSGRLDAVFLDLPSPWEAVPAAKGALRSGGRICCFSPCIEQVQRTAAVLRENYFVELKTYECLLKPIETAKRLSLKKLSFEALPVGENGTTPHASSTVDYTVAYPAVTMAGHTGFLSFATKI